MVEEPNKALVGQTSMHSIITSQDKPQILKILNESIDSGPKNRRFGSSDQLVASSGIPQGLITSNIHTSSPTTITRKTPPPYSSVV